MKLSTWAAAAALILSVSATGANAGAAGDDDTKVTVTGCVLKGEDGDDGFLLANAVEQSTESTTVREGSGESVTQTTTRTSFKPSRVLYWLDDDDDVLEKHLGQLVEVTGEAEGDLETGKIEIEREDDMVELEIEADGREAKVKLPYVPTAVGTSGSVSDDEREIKYVVRKLDVDSARMIAPSCQ